MDMEENNDSPAFKTLIIDNIKYKTTFTKKYNSRKMYEPVDFNKVFSFIPGTIVKVNVKQGAKVKQGTKLLELEAMKMVNIITAPVDGIVSKINVKTGDMVAKNFLLVEMN
jgi:biotin carboxyl carrier protein